MNSLVFSIEITGCVVDGLTNEFVVEAIDPEIACGLVVDWPDAVCSEIGKL